MTFTPNHRFDPLPLLNSDSHIGFVWILSDLLIFVLCFILTLYEPIAYLIVIPIAGSRIRGLVNLLHDTSHGNLHKKSGINNAIGMFLLAPAVFEGYQTYLNTHRQHHVNLGSNLDPDLLEVRFREKEADEKFFLNYKHSLFDRRNILKSVFGSMPKRKYSLDTSILIIFWVTIFFSLGVTFNLNIAVKFFIFIFFVRLFWFHPARLFVEICDHGYFPDINERGISRTLETKSFLSWFIHPHNESYHLLHHIFPSIGMENLPRAHKILLKSHS